MPHPAAGRGSATVTVSATVVLLLLLLAAVAGAVAVITGQEASACTAQPAASSTAAASIPANYLAAFKAAGTEYGIPWTVLAAIGDVETGDGQDDGPSRAGALGPMQFLPPTWKIYGDGGNIMDPADAIPAAARLLAANGAPGNLAQAIFAYNHSAAYVTDVLNQAARYAAGDAQATSAGSALCRQAALGPLPPGTAGTIIAFAEAQLGKPYLYGATGPDAYDCSGLVMMAYRAAGITIPRTSQEQWDWGTRIPASQAQPGDLVFFAGSDGTPAAPGHVGIILNPATHTMIDAYATGYSVEQDTYGLRASKAGLSPVVGFTLPE